MKGDKENIMRKIAYLFIAVLAVFCFTGTVLAKETLWRKNGMPIVRKQGEQRWHTSINDGRGGVIVTWQDYRNGNWDIYAQKLDNNGKPLWERSGIAIATGLEEQLIPKIKSAGNGGAIIAYFSGVAIYAQKIDSNGNLLWNTNGVLVTTVAGGWASEKSKFIAEDGSGGAIICWNEGGFWNNKIYVQRVDANGNLAYPDKVAVSNNPNDQNDPRIISDGSGGAVLSWRSNLAGNVYAQRLDNNGTLLWGDTGVLISQISQNAPTFPIDIIWDNGAIITWWGNGVYVQKVSTTGMVLWGSGISLSKYATYARWPVIVSDGLGGAIVAWEDWRDYYSSGNIDIYAQRINSGGNTLWMAEGVLISKGYQLHPKIASISLG